MRAIARRLLLWRGRSGAAFDYYIDSVNGSDSNTGRSAAQAWATIGKLTSAAVLANGVRIGLAYGGEWGETLNLSSYTGTLVGAYGDPTQPLPTIYGSDLVAKSGWALTGGRTKAYDRTWSHTVDASVGQISVWRRLIADTTGPWVLMAYASSAANCESTADSFNVASPPGGSSVSVFIHPPADSNPNSDLYHYRITKRQDVYVGGGGTIRRVCLMMAGSNNGSFEDQAGGAASESLIMHGHKHNGLGQIATDCAVYQAEGSSRITSASLWVAYRNSGAGEAAALTGCYFDGGATFAGDLHYGHTAGSDTWDSQTISGCYGRRGGSPGSVGNTAAHVWRGCAYEQVTAGCASFAVDLTMDNMTLMFGTSFGGNTPNRMLDVAVTTGTLTDVRCYMTRQTSGGAIFGTGLLDVQNCSMQLDSASYDLTLGNNLSTGLIWRNNIVVGGDGAYQWESAARQPGVGTDYNVWWKGGGEQNFGVNNVNYTSLATYQAAFPSLDQNSVNGDPQLTNPSANDWALGGSSAADTGGRTAGSRMHIALPDWTTRNYSWDRRYLGFNGHVAP
jgi:hypothetical protein